MKGSRKIKTQTIAPGRQTSGDYGKRTWTIEFDPQKIREALWQQRLQHTVAVKHP